MWSAISKIFTRNYSSNEVTAGEDPPDEMDRGERRTYSETDDSFTKQAKQRASIKWLLSKAFNNKVPENIREPFYKDHENQEHLKPQIVGGLANAEIYCRALANIYSDPNYHNLNHWAILQTLSRKGSYVVEPGDGSQLTETTLIQTNPLRMGAHMAVVESIMLLYAKEVLTNDRILAAVQRFSHGRNVSSATPSSHEQGVLLWVQHACNALTDRVERNCEEPVIKGGGDGFRLKPPEFPNCRDLKDLCDGVGLAALVSYYCPDELHWAKIQISPVPSVQDSLHNLRLVRDFCQRCLPAFIFHLQVEDVAYLREYMKLNLLVFLADLFNVMEIHPASCVRDKINSEGFPARNAHGVVHKRNLLHPIVTPIPDLRSGLDGAASSNAFQVSKTPIHVPLKKSNSLQQSQQTLASEFSEDSLRRGSDESFVVHRGRGVPTLRSVVSEEPLIPARLKVSKEKQNNDSKADERGEIAAGKPSNWDEHRKTSFAGRRSRRNSMTDDSQLTIENFGGSQDNINFIGRNPDKEMTVHVGRKISAPNFPVAVENTPVRSTLQDARGSFQLGYDNGCEEKQDDGSEKVKFRRQMSSGDITLKNSSDKEVTLKDLVDGDAGNRMSFADLGKQKIIGENKGIHLVYMNDREEHPSKSSFLNKLSSTNGSEKKTSFAALPNTTTWQQQVNNIQSQESTSNGAETTGTGNVMSSELNDIRLRLEEKRRHIESEKRRMEVAMNKQRQKVGKAAFLQAVAKGRGNFLKSPAKDAAESPKDSAEGGGSGDKTPSPVPESVVPSPKPQRPFTLQEISDDASTVEKKWLDEAQPYMETRRTPDLENMDLEQYQQSLAQMNSNLSDIRSDIQRLAAQQNQMQLQPKQTEHEKIIADQQRQILQLQQQQFQTMHRPQSQDFYMPPKFQPQSYAPPLQTSLSAPHVPQSLYPQPRIAEQSQFFLHDNVPAPSAMPQRRTWGQPQQPPPVHMGIDPYQPQQPELRTWGKPQPIQAESNSGGFVLHHTMDRFQERQERYHESPIRLVDNRYQNGDQDRTLNHSNSFTLSQRHHDQSQYNTSHSTPSASPQHRNVHRQISQLLDDASASKRQPSPVNLQQIDAVPTRERERKISVTHAPVAAPPVDDMEPQNISFIGNNDDAALSESLSRLNITSGSRTYRIPSPTRPLLSRMSPFQQSPSPPVVEPLPHTEVSSLDNDPTAQKGFYISFDDDQPKRPKPPLRGKRGSPKKERSYVETPDEAVERREAQSRLDKKKQLERELEEERLKQEEQERSALKIQQERDRLKSERDASRERQKVTAASVVIIGNELNNPDPDRVDEREKKKERIMMLSLQRRQQQEEAKARKEAEAQRRREIEKAKEEEKARRKEEQAARRAAILEQYKLKKAIEEAEREGKTIDKQDLMSLKPAPKMRAKGSTRPRPKTIHIDSGSVQLAEGMSSRGRKGSSSNLTDSPDDSHGMSPCHSANQTLGRRSSYKTSRDPSPAQVRGRSKISTYQNFKGRKSSSLMNLYGKATAHCFIGLVQGSSTDQDSLAYRFADTDSGLGRATPPRRAPSPGMGLRHLPSPSGPGSLPGLMSKGRRVFDDGSSDISSTPSSMMDYTGPRLYKQPATKSNRSIMLNAVEYCVFPGVVNREAKRRVLEEINRSESKHFLILFRDAGCQFRALYSYCPDTEAVTKLYGTGPKQVNDKMFDKFFKYNSGGKCFSQVHTKHLTVTIDAFTIHNSLWQGKKVNLPNKKDMALVV
ncbi:calmodulin-regulated spectrin-associated protein patronin isoform X4 [Rhynchophorus ferrugineus]|uniref:calmodulin-regulated spectrin-associated protein patronin isoform X4 n=1 Tax=Rhynchophorus ferrugineus TaxID=354439 RepID=UPI003FCCDFCD